jgi:serpin B
MVFVLPDEGVAPEALLQEEDFLARLEFYGDAASWGEVQWSVPKFDVNSDLDLMDALKRLGITDLPDYNRADLSALTDLDAFLSEAKQLARVKVDEEGVEAAAVTILTVECTALPPQPTEVCVMDLDRPFLFLIRTQDVPLFIGIVNQVS